MLRTPAPPIGASADTRSAQSQEAIEAAYVAHQVNGSERDAVLRQVCDKWSGKVDVAIGATKELQEHR